LEIEWNKEWEERTGVWRRVWSMGTREAVGNKVRWWSILTSDMGNGWGLVENLIEQGMEGEEIGRAHV
jgi:hypothetical protein